MATPALDRETILKAVDAWPTDEQVALAHTILDRAAARRPASEERTGSGQTIWDALYGIVSDGTAPPTDEQVAQWLDEHKMEKYGG